MLKTTHSIYFKDSSNMEEIESNTVNLIVTSPPYPMIEMWDEIFSSMNPLIGEALQKTDGRKAFELMNEELNKIWKEVDRVLCDGGMACINIGDATRKIGDSFQLFSNHSKIINFFESTGYHVLPMILWRKQSNKPNKFMGSGMLPPSAYVTLEHEYILILRKGARREFKKDEKEIRRFSSYFWEERNQWFSDIWVDLKGSKQKLKNKELRNRSGAYPFELAYRLINMYSIQEDVVLDPFLGTGTTSLAAVCTGRNSIGYEIDNNFSEFIGNRILDVKNTANDLIKERIENHNEFVKKREEKGEMKHKSCNYGFKVMTGQEVDISFPLIKSINQISENNYEVILDEDVPIVENIKRGKITSY